MVIKKIHGKKLNSQHCIHKTKKEKTTRTLTKATWVNSNAAEGKLFPAHTLCFSTHSQKLVNSHN